MAGFTPFGVMFSQFLCCFLLMCGYYTSTASNLDSSCAVVSEYYGKHVDVADAVPKYPVKDAGLGVCAHTLKYTDERSCCTADMESSFLQQSVVYLQEHIQMANRDLKSGITKSLDLYQDHLKSSMNEARNQTSLTLQHLFQIPRAAFRKTLDIFFSELGAFISGDTFSLESIVDTFFNNLFPHVFEHVLSDPSKVRELGKDFETCLLESYKEIKPFGRVPGDIVKSMRNALDRARIFSESLSVMLGVVDMTESLEMDSHCKRAITRLQYCSMCSGETEVRPCRGLCLNVMRGCLVYAKDLSLTWDELVMEFQNLQMGMFRRNNAQEVLAAFDGNLKAAIWHIMEDMSRVYRQVNQKCQDSTANTSNVDRKHFSTPEGRPASTLSRTPSRRLDSLREDIRHLVNQLQESKGFLQRIADNLCRYDMFYDQVMDSDNCWNGSAIGRYTHSVPELNTISQASYNKEVRVTLIGTTQVVQQKENLEHMRTRLSALFNEEVMQQDDAYNSGTSVDLGSGHSRIADVTINDDEDYNNIGAVSGSGSGGGGDPDDESGTDDNMTPTGGRGHKGQGSNPGCVGNDCGEPGKGGRGGPRSAGSSLRQWSFFPVVLSMVAAFCWTV